MGKPIQETKEAAGQNGNAIKALPLESPVGYGGRKRDWIRILRHLFPHKVRRLLAEHDVLEHDVLEGMRSEVQWLHMEYSLLLQGQLAAHAIAKGRPLHTLADAEVRVYSQWSEDGIIEWLVTQVAVPTNRFIEFGVENFTEALPFPYAQPKSERPHFRWK